MQDETRFDIPVWNQSRLEVKVNEINRRCHRFGWPLVTLNIGEARETHIVTNEITGAKVYYKVVEVEVIAEHIGFDGWRFVATLEQIGDKNVMSAVPGESLPEYYRTAPSKCDHCGHDRHRKNTYVLAHEDGTYKQVGSTCINDFLGGHDALSYAHMLASIASLFEEYGALDPDDLWEGEGGHRNSSGVDLYHYMATVATVIRVDGWMSRTKSNELGLFGVCTASTACDLMNPRFVQAMSKEKREHYAHAQEDSDKAKAVIEWLRSDYFDPGMRRLSDYEWNLSAIVGEEYITWRQTGIAASAFACYDRFRGVQAEIARSEKQSDYVGDIKQRLSLDLTVDLVRTFEGHYGPSRFYVMHDDDGNKFICFYTGNSFDADENDEVKVKATVKKHELDQNGVKQTVLSRISWRK